MQQIGGLLEFPVECPDGMPGQYRGCKEVDVHVSQFLPHETVTLDECEHLLVFHRRRHGKRFEKGENGCSVVEIPAGEFTYDEWMTGNFPGIEQICKAGFHFPQMRNPYGRIDKNHAIGCLFSVSA